MNRITASQTALAQKGQTPLPPYAPVQSTLVRSPNAPLSMNSAPQQLFINSTDAEIIDVPAGTFHNMG